MCPQPLSTMDRTGSYILTNEGMTRKPTLGALVAEAIGGWAMIEAYLGDAFAAMIGNRRPVTMGMFSAVQSPEIRQVIFLAAAREVMPKRYVRMGEAVLRTLKPLYDQRNKFAHWLWAISPIVHPKLEDALLLIEPRKHWENVMAGAKHGRKRRVGQLGLFNWWATAPKLSPDFIFVYQEAELRRICSQMERGFRNSEMLAALAGAKGSRRRPLYDRLLLDTDIQAALRQIQKNETKARRPKPNKS